MCCCCPSAKFRRPEFGNDNYERAATILTVILFLLVFPELIAYATLTDVYVKSEAVQCCGMIVQKSLGDFEAPCKEKDFPDVAPKIGMVEVDGSVYCQVDGVICSVWYPEGVETRMDECLSQSDQGYNITQICSPEILASEADATTEVMVGILTFIFGFITAAVAFCDFFGCFREMCLCQSKIYQGFNKIIEIVCWLFFLISAKIYLENPAQNGYTNTNSLTDNAAYDYFADHCETYPIWTEFTLDVPEWVVSNGFDAVGWIGLALSIVDFILFFVIICRCKNCQKSSNESNEVEMQTSKQIKTTNVATELAAV